MMKKPKKKSPLQIAREIFPEVPKGKKGDNSLGYIIWNFTGYPSFWDGDPETCFRRQLQEYHDDPEGVETRQQEALDSIGADTK